MVLVAAQQVAAAALVRLANGGPDSTVVLLTLAQTVALVPIAVLALPLSVAVLPRLATATAAGDRVGFDATLARALRWVLLGAGLGVALLVAGAPLAPKLFPAVPGLPGAIIAFAPGVFGFALLTLLGRGLTAAGAASWAAGTAVVGWAVAVLVGAVVAGLTPGPDRVIALGAGWSVGVSVLGIGLLLGVHRRRGAAAWAGTTRTVLVSVAGAALAGGVGGAVAATVPVLGWPVLGAPVAAVVFAGTAVVGGGRRGWR